MTAALARTWTPGSVGRVALAAALAACATESVQPADQPGLCKAVIVDPVVVPLAVGDAVQLTASFDTSGACTPLVAATDLRWSTPDPAVAQVDSLSGAVTAVAPGHADIEVSAAGSSRPLGSGRVIVFAPLYDRIVTIRFRIRCSDPSCVVWSINGPLGIWTVAPDGSQPRVVRDSLRYPDHPRVSPDGRSVLYEQWGSLYVVDGAGHTVREVRPASPYHRDPSWSPDGGWIVFSAYDPATAKFQVFVSRPDGTGVRQLTTDPFGAVEPAWSPDGATIVYVRDSVWATGGNAGAAFVMDTTGGGVRSITDGITGFRGRMPQWSPDGTRLVFISRPYVTRLDVAGGTYDTLAYHDDNRPASWSPDAARVIAGSGEISYTDPSQASPIYGMQVLLGLGPDSMFNHSPFYGPPQPPGVRVRR